MLHEVEQPWERGEAEARQRLAQACRLLRWVDPELAEWTAGPAAAEGRYVFARLLISDPRAPLAQLAGTLRRIAAQLDRLARNQQLRFPEKSP